MGGFAAWLTIAIIIDRAKRVVKCGLVFSRCGIDITVRFLYNKVEALLI